MSEISIYGSRLCPDTVEALEIFERKGIAHKYLDITRDLANLKAFLKYRDAEPVYGAVRASGGIGIPLFIITGGDKEIITLDMDEALKNI